jgi:two-component system, NtrC family, sensor kinase
VGLQGRLLAGLAVLVFAAIGSSGWLAVRVASDGLDAAEEARARGLGTAAAGVIARSWGTGGAGARERLAGAATGLLGLGGITEVAVVDAEGKALFGDPARDPAIGLARAGGAAFARRNGDFLKVYAPLRSEGGERVGALRVELAVGANVGAALQGSNRLLLALTLTDGALILLFGALFVRSVVRPLGDLARAAQRVAEGDLSGPPVEAGGGEVGALADAFSRMTASLREQRERLEATRAQVVAQEKLATVGRLAAGVAHEIGNPLTSVLGYVDLLLPEMKGESRDLLERVKGETARIHRIVHDLLEYARPVADEIEPVRLGEVIDSALDLLHPQPRFRDVTVERPPSEAPPAAASPRRLLQVLLNLLLNAADATAGKGTVRITLGAEGERVWLTVADDGPGVPAADRARIFDPFFTTKEPGAGTGLGLAVCQSIVQAYGGEIGLVPSEKGAAFRVTLKKWAGELHSPASRSA